MTLSLRPLAPGDAQAVADIVGDCDAFFSGDQDRPTADDILDWCERRAAEETVDVDAIRSGAAAAVRESPSAPPPAARRARRDATSGSG